MSSPPPDDLRDWGKNALIREVERLRAIVREHAETRGGDPRVAATDGNAVIDVSGDPHVRRGALLDIRSAVLMDTIDVSIVDDYMNPMTAFLVLGGRVNCSTDRVEHAYLMPADGAAGLATEMIGLASRASNSPDTMKFMIDFMAEFERRIAELP